MYSVVEHVGNQSAEIERNAADASRSGFVLFPIFRLSPSPYYNYRRLIVLRIIGMH